KNRGRIGGIFLPLVKSLCVACGSNVDDGTEEWLQSWLMLTCFQTSVISSAMFLTAMAANPLNTIKNAKSKLRRTQGRRS
ncbi:dicarboxylate transporter 1, partial [Quercus suber]